MLERFIMKLAVTQAMVEIKIRTIPVKYFGSEKSARCSLNTIRIPEMPAITPKKIIAFGRSVLLTLRLMAITHTGMAEQMMAATLLGTYIDAQETNPFPNVISRNPPRTCRRM